MAEGDTVPNQERVANDPVRPLRTYRDDVAQAVKKERLSVVGIAAREQERAAMRSATGADAAETPRARLIFAAAGTLLILLGAGAAYYAYSVSTRAPEAARETALPSLIFVDAEVKVSADGTTTRSFLVKLKRENDAARLTLGAVALLYPVRGAGREERALPASEFLAAIGARAPAALVRSLEPLFTAGTHAFDGNQPFLILKTDQYETAFAGMLAWEETLSEDLEPFFGTAIRSAVAGEPRIGGIFESRVIGNRDVRVLPNAEGTTALLYGFRDPATIILTTNENTWAEVNARLSSARRSQ